MADASAISWTDATFNPWIGCAKVSPACAHCYAETLAENRMGLTGDAAVWGVDAGRRIVADATWRKPIRWAKLARDGLLPDKTENRDGHRPRVFCASMADVFEERLELDPPRRRLFDLIEQTPELDWLLLTKRPEYARSWLDAYYSENYFRGIDVPLANVWMGVSIENARFTWRADVLRGIPATARFISAEPLLGSLLSSARLEPCHGAASHEPSAHLAGSGANHQNAEAEQVGRRLAGASRRKTLDLTGIDWLIVGGESGGRASRPTHPEWVRQLRDYATSTETAFHFKQWGSYAPRGFVSGLVDVDRRDEKELGGFRCFYYGAASKAAGKTLDGREWCEFPREAVPA